MVHVNAAIVNDSSVYVFSKIKSVFVIINQIRNTFYFLLTSLRLHRLFNNVEFKKNY